MTFCGSQEAPIDYFLLDVSIFPQLLIKPFAFFQKPRFFLQILCRGPPCTPCVPTPSQPATSPSHIRLSILRLTSMYFPHTVTRQPPLGLWPPSPALSPASLTRLFLTSDWCNFFSLAYSCKIIIVEVKT